VFKLSKEGAIDGGLLRSASEPLDIMVQAGVLDAKMQYHIADRLNGCRGGCGWTTDDLATVFVLRGAPQGGRWQLLVL
jgi:hypothetical protein